ncbi:hypothetical protein CXB51_016735 [Gossypium anomalum]|uniref:Uncharacterized protein n=1 Tax=Gossypium anomalum TaxID=47600 RepID=A0A8J5YG10_9ROSI|nr:hypothetical protein CXB51_016735 [Gossypium anomalum]
MVTPMGLYCGSTLLH